MNGFLPAFITLILVVFIIFLSYAASKYIADKANGMMNTKYMKIVDKMPLGPDKSIIITQIGDKYFLIGIASANISILKELDKDDIISFIDDDNNNNIQKFAGSFKNILSNVMKDKK